MAKIDLKKDCVIPPTRIENELKMAFDATCTKRNFDRSMALRFLIIHFVKNPDMKFDI